jgi:outer membrane protein OmpA-like peptidoglycan-associated protein
VPPERLRALAEQRARALRDALASAQGLDAAQIRAEAAPEAGAPEAVLELRPR